MTIQIKRGNGADRPNPLLNGELGWDADNRRLWIGNGVANENLFVAGAAVTADFSVYVCTTALGGGAGDADGLAKNSGTTTATTANKLVDSAASFDSSYVGKTVYNITDDTWAKITAVDSTTTLSLSANIMASGEDYETTNAFDNVPDGFAAVPGPYSANVTLRISPGTFSEDVTFIGKIAAGAKTLTVQGSTTGTTTIDGAVELSQKVTINDITFSDTTINANYGAEITWSNCPLVNTRLNTKNGSDLSWTTCNGSGTTKLYTYLGSKNLITTSTITVGNNPENITNINSTITKNFTMYVATVALGGNDAVADGLAITSGSATGTTTNKLVDSGANFGSDLVGRTLWNSTDDTWAKVNAVDSATQLSLSANIMASGEDYTISNAFSTIQGAVDAIPGTVNCILTVKVCNATWNENVIFQGKGFSGTYYIRLAGTLTDQLGKRDVSSATQTTAVINGAAMTTNAHVGQLVKIIAGTGVDQRAIVYSNTTNTLTIMRSWNGSTSGIVSGLYKGVNPDATSDVKVCTWGTLIDSVKIAAGQKSILVEDVKLISGDPAIPGSFVVDGLSGGELYGSWINNGGGYRGLYVLNGSLGDCISSYIENCNLTQYATNSMGNMYNVWSKKRISPTLNSMLVFRAGRIDMTGTPNQSAMDIEGMSVWAAGFDAGTAVTLTGASGAGYDLSARNMSLARGSTNVNNTIGTKNIDASSTET